MHEGVITCHWQNYRDLFAWLHTRHGHMASFAQVMGDDGQQMGAPAFVTLLHAAGAEAQHCSEAWVGNHYRWIVWKLACYERRCPEQLLGRMLTVPIILDQLKYRYLNCNLISAWLARICRIVMGMQLTGPCAHDS